MFDDINLLPDEMREKERDLRSHETPLPKPKLEYSHPKPVAHEAKDHNDNLSWWQKLNNTQVNLFGAKAEVNGIVNKTKYSPLPQEQSGKNLSNSKIADINKQTKTAWWRKIFSNNTNLTVGVMQKAKPEINQTTALSVSNNNQVPAAAAMLPPSPQKIEKNMNEEVVKKVEMPQPPIVPPPNEAVKVDPVVSVEHKSSFLSETPKVEISKTIEVNHTPSTSAIDKKSNVGANQVGRMNQVTANQFNKTGQRMPFGSLMPDVNLIPSEQRFVSLLSTYVILIASFVIAVIVVAVGYYGLSAYNNKVINQAMADQTVLITEQDNLEKEIGQSEMSLAVKMRLDSFTEVIKRHLGWNGVFNLVEDNTLTTVGWTTFAGDAVGKVSLSGEAPNYTAVAKQLKALQSLSAVEGVSLTGLGQKRDNSNIITFQLVVTLKPEVFVSSK